MKEILQILDKLLGGLSEKKVELRAEHDPIYRYCKLPTQTSKMIGKCEAFKKEFGFEVPEYALKAYLDFYKKGLVTPRFFRKLHELQYLHYDENHQKVSVKIGFIPIVELSGASIISLICLSYFVYILFQINGFDSSFSLEPNYGIIVFSYISISFFISMAVMLFLWRPCYHSFKFCRKFIRVYS